VSGTSLVFRHYFNEEVEPMLITIFANIFLVLFLFTELFLRKKGESSSLKADKSDNGTTRIIFTTYISSIILLLVLTVVKIGFFENAIVGWAGLSFMASGLIVRFLSMRELGKFYSRTLRTTENQKLITTGPYRLIRHPGYLSSICIWIGTGLALQNFVLIPAFLLVFVSVYIYRITSEERMLAAEFGEDYTKYQSASWRLLPYLY
jgi:protein-S-isoprenylcysteine O-methyltransferase Ste14